MPQIVKADLRHARALNHPVKAAAHHVGGLDGTTDFAWDDQPFIAPCEYMAKKIPGARLEVIAGAGHSSNLDQPEAFNRVLRDFLDGLP